MLATYVAARNTPVKFETAQVAMSAALATVLGAHPSVEVLALAMAKTTLEAGRSGDDYWAFSKHWNIGNIKAGNEYAGSYTTFTCNEILNNQVVWFSPFGRLSGKSGVVVSEKYENPPGHPQTRFRAYENVFEGAAQYIEFVATGRYVDAFKELLEGDAPGYVAALHRKGYFTADPEVYGRGVLSLHKEFIARLSGRPAPNLFVPSVEYVDSVVAKQAWNQQEIRVLATAAATEAMFDNLEALRRDARREMSSDPNALQDPDDEESTVRDGKGNV